MSELRLESSWIMNKSWVNYNIKWTLLLPLYLSDAFFPFPRIFLRMFTNDFTVGRMLNGGGRVEPASKYDIHSLVRANFHSLSSGRIICEYQPINPMQHKLSYYRDTFIGWIYQWKPHTWKKYKTFYFILVWHSLEVGFFINAFQGSILKCLHSKCIKICNI